MTMASVSRACASPRKRLRGRRVASTRALTSNPAFWNVSTARRAFSRCSSHSRFMGCSQGFGKPRLVPQTRAIVITKISAFPGRANSIARTRTGRAN